MNNDDMAKLSAEELQRDLFYKSDTAVCYGADGGLLGNPLIATAKNGCLKYELNKNYEEYYLDRSKEMARKLAYVIELTKHCMLKKDKYSKYSLQSIYTSLLKVQAYALSYGYLREAEELTKMIYREFGVTREDDLQRIVSAYGRRQIMRCVDCSKDVDRVMADIENKEYGIMPWIHNQSEFDSLKRRYYKGATVNISEPVKKWYGVKYVDRTFTMKNHEIAKVEQKAIIESVATM